MSGPRADESSGRDSDVQFSRAAEQKHELARCRSAKISVAHQRSEERLVAEFIRVESLLPGSNARRAEAGRALSLDDIAVTVVTRKKLLHG